MSGRAESRKHWSRRRRRRKAARGDWCGLERKDGDDSRGGVRSRLTSERKGSDRRRMRGRRREGGAGDEEGGEGVGMC